jgi:hypothetical protein
MKTKILLIFLYVLVATSCNDDFMERYPKTEISPQTFFNTDNDLKLYTNGFYDNFTATTVDVGSDNVAQMLASTDGTWDTPDTRKLIQGNITVDDDAGWNWSELRSYNYFFDNYNKASGPPDEIANYVGIAKYFRALFYIDKVKTFSDVPWYSEVVDVEDDDLLYKTQDPRGLIVDSVIADLQYAINHIKYNDDNTLITKYAALACLARFALYEGTFRKYAMDNPSEAEYLNNNGAGDWKRLIEIARDASDEIIRSGRFSLYSDYSELFHSYDLNPNPEVILYIDYEQGLTTYHSASKIIDRYFDLSQSLVDEYLKIDGTAYTQEELDTLQYINTFKNRDFRLKATIAEPGWIRPGLSDPRIPVIDKGGYGQVKYTPLNAQEWDDEKSYNDVIVYRYAEILLINAEAHSELGTLTNEILDRTVNALRRRAGITSNFVTIASPVDVLLKSRYPNVKAQPEGAALEVRRERRIELACEGIRLDDIYRWHIGDETFTVNGKPENLQKGMYVPQMQETGGAKFTLIEATGDDIEDIIIAKSNDDLDKAEAYYNDLGQGEWFSTLVKTSLGDIIELERGEEGHIIFVDELEHPAIFVEPKYNYRPVPRSEIILNENLKQQIFWK